MYAGAVCAAVLLLRPAGAGAAPVLQRDVVPEEATALVQYPVDVNGGQDFRLEHDACDGYAVSTVAITQAALQSAIDGSSSVCIEIAADLDLVRSYDDYTALGIEGGKKVRLWTLDGAILNGQGYTRILRVEAGAVVKIAGLTFYNGYVSVNRVLPIVQRPRDSPSLTPPRPLCVARYRRACRL